jgi:hypothetical protein
MSNVSPRKTRYVTAWLTPLVVAAVSCAGSAPTTKPDAMRATEHHAAAEREGELAQAEAARYLSGGAGPSAIQPKATSHDDYTRTVPVDNLPEGPLAEAEKHRRLARQHEASARYLREYEEAECRGVPAPDRAACPLLGAVDRVENISNGVRLGFAAGMPVEAVFSRMRCHYAYERARAFDGSESCPLYARGMEIRRGIDPMAIELTAEDSVTIRRIRASAREDAGLVGSGSGGSKR